MCFGNEVETGKEVKTNSIPQYLTDASQSNIAALNDLRSNGFESYGGPIAAGASGNQDQAFGMSSAIAGSSNPYTATSQDAFTRAATAGPQSVSTQRAIDDVPGAPGTAGGSTQDYMNPYVAQVLAPQLRDIDQQAALRQNQSDAQATMSGAFGDARTGFAQAQNSKNQQLARTDAIGKTYSDAYTNAMSLKEGDIARNLDTSKTNAALNEQGLSRAITGGQALTGLDQYDTGRTSDLIQQLLASGGVQRGINQDQLTAAYNEFLRKQQRPLQTSALVTSAINGAPHDTNSVDTKSAPDNSGYGIIGSIAGTAAKAIPFML